MSERQKILGNLVAHGQLFLLETRFRYYVNHGKKTSRLDRQNPPAAHNGHNPPRITHHGSSSESESSVSLPLSTFFVVALPGRRTMCATLCPDCMHRDAEGCSAVGSRNVVSPRHA